MVIKGSIDEIRFRNEQNGYSIIVMDIEGEPIITVGTFPPVAEGEYLTLTGDFVIHPKFGKQFKATNVSNAKPDTLDGIIRYLGSGLIKGIGPKTALTIVEHFGIKTLDIIENQPYRLTGIRGISKAKAEEIVSAFGALKSMQDAIMFLQGHNLSLNMSLKIHKYYGSDVIAKVSTNPYKLIEDIDGVGFLTADKLARSLGIERTSDFRLRAGIVYVLKDSGEKNGNTYLPMEDILSEVKKLLGIEDTEALEKNIQALVLEHRIKLTDIDGINCIMLTSTYRTEKNAATLLVKLSNDSGNIKHEVISEIAEFERANNILFHDQQKVAIESGINEGVVVITGGPGTGKTTIIKCILFILNKFNLRTALMAPTGRAAKRLSESTGDEAKTIHRALMMDADSNFYKTDGEKLVADVIIVDEFSMVDIFLFNTLLSRLSAGTKAIFVGDKDQLPSVGAGNVLADILASGIIPTVALSQIYRQAEQSLIVTNAHLINSGMMPDLKCVTKDFFFSNGRDAGEIAKTVEGMVNTRIPKFLDIEPFKVQVLCPMKNGLAGSINLNKLLQNALNPHKDNRELIEEDYCFRVGDKVMHIANNYNLEWKRHIGYMAEDGNGVFNGDLGVIRDIRIESGEIDVFFEDGRVATYTQDIRNQLILAYAITVHKSQGSEFDAVVVPIVSGNYMIMTRNLLYTAITRAKRMVVLVGSESNIKRMVDNNYIAKRFSALNKFIVEAKQSIEILYST